MLTDRTFDDSRALIVSGPGTQSGSDAGPGLFKRLSRDVLGCLSVSCPIIFYYARIFTISLLDCDHHSLL